MFKRFFLLKKWQKITIYILIFLLIVGVVLYQYAIRHAATLLEELVHNKSDGKVALKVNNVKFRWAKNTVLLNNSHLYNTERDTDNTKYDFHIQQLSLNMTDVFALIFDDNISITNISLLKPRIVVETNLLPTDSSVQFSTEAGNVFSSIQNGLKAIQVDRFNITDGSFSLIQYKDTIPVMINLSQFNLKIDNFDPANISDETKLFSDNIYFETFDQNLIFPDGKYKLQFQKLSIGTENQFIQLDSCTIANVHKNIKKGDVQLYFDVLRLTNIDFRELYENDFIIADSMFGKNAALDLQLNLAEKNNQFTLDSLLTNIGVDIQLKYVGVENLSTKIQTTKQGKVADFSTNGDDISIQNLQIRSEGDKPFEIDRFEMAVREYVSYTVDSLYQFKFDSIKIVNSSIVLSNLNVSSYKNPNVRERYQVPQFVLNDLDWEELLVNQHLRAKNATLYQPELYFNQFVKNTKGDSKSVYEVFSDIRQFIYMDNITILDGNLEIHSFNNTSFLFEDISCNVSIFELLRAESSSMIESSVQAFQFEKGTLKAAGLNLNTFNVVYNTEDTYFHIDSLFLADSTSQLKIDAYKVWLHGPNFDEFNSFLHLDSLKWEKGNLAYQKGIEKDKPFPISVFINYIQGQKTSFDLEYTQNIQGYLNQINAFNLEVNEEKIFKIQQVDANGEHLNIFDDKVLIFTKEFVISDHAASKFKNLEFTMYNNPDTLKVLADEIDFLPGNTNLKDKIFEVERLALYEPTVVYDIYPKTKINLEANIDTIEFLFKDLVFINPQITYNVHYTTRIDNIIWESNNKTQTDSLSIKNGFMKLDSNINLSIQSLHLNGDDITINQSFGIDFTYLSQPIKATVKALDLTKAYGEKKWKWQAYFENFEHKGIGIGSIGLEDANLLISEGSYQSLWLKSDWKDVFTALSNNPSFKAKIGASAFEEVNHIIEWDSVYYNATGNYLDIFQFKYQPSVSLTEFLKTLKYQTDYLICEIPQMKMIGIEWVNDKDEWRTHIASLLIKNMNFSAYRDKHAVLDTTAYKKLPVEMVKGLDFPFYIKEAHLQNATATYSELGWNKVDTGVIKFEQLNAQIKNIKNLNYHIEDSLVILAKAQLFNQIPVELFLRESYTDIEKGFKAALFLGKGNLKTLNAPLLSLANLGIKKGNLEDLNINVVANADYAWGKTLMRYKNLQVRVNQKNRKSFSPIKTILANAFVLSNKNKKQEKIVFVERLKDRSIFNYLVKIVFDAATTSIGVKNDKNNKKQINHLKLSTPK